jgi:hypothetical protein
MFARLRAAVKSLPSVIDYGAVWFNPKTQTVFFNLGDWEEEIMYKDWADALKVKGVKEVISDAEAQPPKHKGPWLRVKTANGPLGPLAQAGGWKEGPIASMFGGPNPVSATVASGVLGAGLGYGAGVLAEHVLPAEYFEKGKLRRSLGIAGGLAGALPGFWAGTVNMRHGASLLAPIGAEKQSGISVAQALHSLNNILDVFLKPDSYTQRETLKLANAFQDSAGALGAQQIDKDRFNRVIWDDPFTPPAVKGMASGLAEGSSLISGDDRMFSPMDTARLGASIAGNAAVGWVAGSAAGKVMGAITGLSEPGQVALQRAGVLGGLLTSVIPKVFGSSNNNPYYG